MRTARFRIVALAVAIVATAPRPAQPQRAPFWQVAGGLAFGLLQGPGEVGRSRNATGEHEDLIARLPDGGVMALNAAVETGVLGFELRLLFGGAPLEVENEYGVKFPYHGEPPTIWNAGIVAYPFFLFRRTWIGRRLQPQLMHGVGGLIAWVDLDNINDQSVYHAWQRSDGAGLRIYTEVADTPWQNDLFVEVRWSRHRVRRHSPLREFETSALSVGVGMRY